MTAMHAAKAAKGVYSALKDGGAGTDPNATAEKAWTLLTPYQRLDWMRMSGEELHIIYCANEWGKLPLEHRMRLCHSLTSMVELFARIGAAKEANGKGLPGVQGQGGDTITGKADVRSGALDGKGSVPGGDNGKRKEAGGVA